MQHQEQSSVVTKGNKPITSFQGYCGECSSCRLIEKLLGSSKVDGDALDKSTKELQSVINNSSLQSSEGVSSLLAAANDLRLRLLCRAAALEVLQNTGLVPDDVSLDTQLAPEQPAEAPVPTKKGKGGKAEVSEVAQPLAMELPKPLLQEVEAGLAVAQNSLNTTAASYYSKRDSGREITRAAIKQDAEEFLASRHNHFTALKDECDEHIAIEQKRFGHQVCHSMLPDVASFTTVSDVFALLLLFHNSISTCC